MMPSYHDMSSIVMVIVINEGGMGEHASGRSKLRSDRSKHLSWLQLQKQTLELAAATEANT